MTGFMLKFVIFYADALIVGLTLALRNGMVFNPRLAEEIFIHFWV